MAVGMATTLKYPLLALTATLTNSVFVMTLTPSLSGMERSVLFGPAGVVGSGLLSLAPRSLRFCPRALKEVLQEIKKIKSRVGNCERPRSVCNCVYGRGRPVCLPRIGFTYNHQGRHAGLPWIGFTYNHRGRHAGLPLHRFANRLIFFILRLWRI